MALQAIGVTYGSPNVSGQVPTTDTNIAADIATAVTATATLNTAIGSAQTASSTSTTAAGTAATDTAAAVTAVGTALSDFDAALGTGTNGLAGLLSLTYTSHQIVGSASISATLTSTQQNALVALVNTALTALLAAQTAMNTANTAATTSSSDAQTTNTDVQALSTTPISTALTAAQTVLTNENLFIQFDSSVVTNIATFNNGLVSALAFARDAGMLPL